LNNNCPEQLDHLIDLMVYKLYKLSYKDCKIVDPQVEKIITRENYEKMTIKELAEYELKE
jgi:hypothetical protein